MVLSETREASPSSSGKVKNIISRGNSKYTGFEAEIASQVYPRRVMLKNFKKGCSKT